jgi:hypothetical protein
MKNLLVLFIFLFLGTQLFAQATPSEKNASLTALREGFNLDSIAGQGSDVLKILNLLHWVHDLIPHDGMHGNPEVKNAMSTLEVCKKENSGVNGSS